MPQSRPMTESSRRDTERVEIPGGLYGDVMVYQPMTITEISTRGAQTGTTVRCGLAHSTISA